jgi:hypothetical protein
VGKLPKDDQEDDEAGDPRVSLVGVDNLISEKSDQEGGGGNHDDSGPSWHVAIDGIEKLRTNNDID